VPWSVSSLVFYATNELVNEVKVIVSSAKMVEATAARIVAGVKHLVRKLTTAEKESKAVSIDMTTIDTKSPVPRLIGGACPNPASVIHVISYWTFFINV
jgi:hypothetical protein